jgi:hypothetical protein
MNPGGETALPSRDGNAGMNKVPSLEEQRLLTGSWSRLLASGRALKRPRLPDAA